MWLVAESDKIGKSKSTEIYNCRMQQFIDPPQLNKQAKPRLDYPCLPHSKQLLITNIYDEFHILPSLGRTVPLKGVLKVWLKVYTSLGEK